MLRKISRLPCCTRSRNRGCLGALVFLFMVALIILHDDQEVIKTQEVRVALDYLKRSLDVTLNSSTTILQPFGTNMCKNNGSEHYMLMMYITSPDNEAERKFIRNNFKTNVAEWEESVLESKRTEYKTGDVMKMLFFVGMPDREDTKEQLITEWESHGDIIVDDFKETYLNLTLKTVRMLKWIQTYCPDVKFLLKVDGDVYFNMGKLVSFLESQGESSARNLIAGHEYESIGVDSDYTSKWYTPPSVFQGKLPSFVGGFFYVLGSNARSRLYDEVFKTTPFHMEDVFLTGFVRNATELQVTNIQDIRTWWQFSDNAKSACLLDNYVAVHPLAVDKLMCWTRFSKRNYECHNWPIIFYC